MLGYGAPAPLQFISFDKRERRLYGKVVIPRNISAAITRSLLTIALVCIATCVISARAATIERSTTADGRAGILIKGVIVAGDDEQFSTIAGSVAGSATVILDSPGGMLAAGLRIGSAIRMRAWDTVVPDGATCASACGLMWLGGVQRTVGRQARVGFHAAFVQDADGSKRETGAGNALVGSYLSKLGLTDAAVFYLTSAAPQEAAWLTETVARQVGIRASFADAGFPATPVAAQAPAVPQAPQPDASPPDGRNTPEGLMAQLYADFPWSVRLPSGESCLEEQCRLRLIAADSWTGSDGVERRMVAAVAEYENGCHACAAILGVGLFRMSEGSARKEIATPAVDRVGAWGKFSGTLRLVDGGDLGRILVLEDSDMHQGVVDGGASIVMAVNGAYKRVLDVPTQHDMGGNCDVKVPSCLQQAQEENYSSEIKVSPEVGAVRVDQTFKASFPMPPASWEIDGSGTAKQTSGGKAEAGSGARERAGQQSPAFDQGRADRMAYEAWFAGLQGDERAGAVSWAERRSLRMPGTCNASQGQSSQWSMGCGAARKMLARSDARRKAEPDYRRGWNSL